MVLKTIAVTGSSGMLGRHIASRLKSDGFNVISFTRNKTNNSSNSRNWDLTNFASNHELDILFSDVDILVHAGAAVPGFQNIYGKDELLNINVISVVNIANWCRKKNIPLVYISGAIVYGDPNSQNIKESSHKGWNELGGFYGLSKLLADDLLVREMKAGLKVSILRPSSIYGFGLRADKTITSFLNEISNNRPIILKQPIDDCIDFIHAADVSSAISLVIKKEEWTVFNLSSGDCTSMIDLANECVSVCGFGSIEISSEAISNEPVSRFNLDNTLARDKLSWSPVVGLHEGVQSILNDTIINLYDS
jgi:UDP-glucose 4-epimerase